VYLDVVLAVVDWGAHSSLGRALVLFLVLSVGLILWVHGARHHAGAKPALTDGARWLPVRASLVVTSLSFVWIFSRHPLYPALHDQ